jgi:hypothetical protein
VFSRHEENEERPIHFLFINYNKVEEANKHHTCSYIKLIYCLIATHVVNKMLLINYESSYDMRCVNTNMPFFSKNNDIGICYFVNISKDL